MQGFFISTPLRTPDLPFGAFRMPLGVLRMPLGTFRPPSGTTGMPSGIVGMPSGTTGMPSGALGMASGAFRPPSDHSDPPPNVPTRVGMKFLILLIVACCALTLRFQISIRVEVMKFNKIIPIVPSI